MQPVTPTYTWAYTGSADYAARLRKDNALTHRLYHATGCMVHATFPSFRLAFLREGGLDLKDKLIAGQGSYNFYQLTGQRMTTQSMKSGSGFLNIHTLDYDDEVLDLVGITKNQLGTLCAHHDTRPLLSDAAGKLGIASGIPVVPTMPDGALNQVGSGALGSGMMTFSVGTSGALRMAVDEPVIPDEPSTWCYYTAGKHLCGAATAGATNCVDWYTKTILGGRVSYSELEGLIRDKENAPVFLPFLFGERCPGWRDKIKGAFTGLGGSTGIGDQYYAVLEGILFNLYQCYLKVTDITGDPKKIFVSGGICQSNLWLSMLTDIFQKEIILQESAQASMLGGAVLALAAAGGIDDIEAFSLDTERIIQPNTQNKAFYQQRFARYLDAYQKIDE